ncbi:YicC family protein [bacterium]|nr:YicC family protein [bacterium]
MTGFGQAEIKSPHGNLLVELRAVNHRFFDLKTKLPPELVALEPRLRSCLQKRIERGALSLFVSWKREKPRQVKIDRGLARQYYREMKALQRELNLPGGIGMELLVNFPEMVRVEEKKESLKKLWPILKEALKRALRDLLVMKEREGRDIGEDVSKRVGKVETELKTIKRRSPQVITNYRKRLRKRVKELGVGVAEGRLEIEIAILAERADTSEELNRLDSLLSQFKKIMMEERAVGRRLEFTLQEMNREINTIGAKGADATVSSRVIRVKSELEKIREEIQNIE